VPGIDLPAGFVEDIKTIDNGLHFVYHPYRIQYDDITNRYYGPLENPRWVIGEQYGKEVWGWVLTDNEGCPIVDESWHIWSLTKDYGWSHVSNIASTEPEHLFRIVNRLGREKLYRAKFGAMKWNQKLREDLDAFEQKKLNERHNLFADVQSANKTAMKTVMENLERGIVNPTRPTKDIITSYGGQSNRSRITREITDREGGLIVPE
jgi:hypothetical protein